MPQTGSPSYLANAANRRRGLNRVRQALLDQPGTQRAPASPPPAIPAQRPNPQQQAVEQIAAAPVPRPAPAPEGQPQPPGTPPQNVLGLDEETRARLMEQITPVLLEIQKQKRAALHRRVGRARRFFGGGL